MHAFPVKCRVVIVTDASGTKNNRLQVKVLLPLPNFSHLSHLNFRNFNKQATNAMLASRKAIACFRQVQQQRESVKGLHRFSRQFKVQTSKREGCQVRAMAASKVHGVKPIHQQAPMQPTI